MNNTCPNCGSKHISEEQIWSDHFYPHTNSFGYCYVCCDCGFRSEPKGTKSAAQKQWNRGNGQVYIKSNPQKESIITRLFRSIFR